MCNTDLLDHVRVSDNVHKQANRNTTWRAVLNRPGQFSFLMMLVLTFACMGWMSRIDYSAWTVLCLLAISLFNVQLLRAIARGRFTYCPNWFDGTIWLVLAWCVVQLLGEWQKSNEPSAMLGWSHGALMQQWMILWLMWTAFRLHRPLSPKTWRQLGTVGLPTALIICVAVATWFGEPMTQHRLAGVLIVLALLQSAIPWRQRSGPKTASAISKLSCAGPILAMVIALLWQMPLENWRAIAVMVPAAIALMYIRSASQWVIWGVSIATAIAYAGIWTFWLAPPTGPMPWLGLNGAAMTHTPPGAAGWLALLNHLGLPLTTILLVLLLRCAAAMLRHKDVTGRPSSIGSALLATAMMTSVGLVLGPGGLFQASAWLTLALTWSLAGRWNTSTAQQRSGWWFLAPFGVMLWIMALLPSGFLRTTNGQYGLDDKHSHAIIGYLIVGVLSWWLGLRWWAIALALVAAATMGLIGEWLQPQLSLRSFETADLVHHFIGNALGALPIVVISISRWLRSRNQSHRWEVQYGPARSRGLALYRGSAVVLIVLTTLVIITNMVWAIRPAPPPWIAVSDAVIPSQSTKTFTATTGYCSMANRSPWLLNYYFWYDPDRTTTVYRTWQTSTASGYRHWIRPCVPTPKPGETRRIRVVGRPRGPLALAQDTGRCFGLGPNQPILCLDASWWVKLNSQQQQELRHVLKLSSPPWQAICIYHDEIGCYKDIREETRDVFPNAAVFMTWHEPYRETCRELLHQCEFHTNPRKLVVLAATPDQADYWNNILRPSQVIPTWDDEVVSPSGSQPQAPGWIDQLRRCLTE